MRSKSHLHASKAYVDITLTLSADRLQSTDVKSGHYERKVQALEASRDQWEAKYEEMSAWAAGTPSERVGTTDGDVIDGVLRPFEGRLWVSETQ